MTVYVLTGYWEDRYNSDSIVLGVFTTEKLAEAFRDKHYPNGNPDYDYILIVGSCLDPINA